MTPIEEAIVWFMLAGLFFWVMYLQDKTEKLEIRIRDLKKAME